jgi:predicted transcriptional regulator
LSDGKFRSKADLMLRIKQARLLLNGRYRDGSKATFASDFKFTRYAIVLLAAISISNFEYHTKKIKNTTFISYYNLYKVARFLGLEFERTKSAPYIYKELIERGQVRIVVENRRTFVTFTDKGKKSCEEKLEELQHLNEEFNSNPTAQQKYKEEDDAKERITKGTSTRMGIETKIDRLIEKIAQW